MAVNEISGRSNIKDGDLSHTVEVLRTDWSVQDFILEKSKCNHGREVRHAKQ